MDMSKVACSGQPSKAPMRKASILASTLVLILGSVLLSAFANAETYSSNPYKSLEEKITAALSSGGSGPITVQDVKKTSAAGLLEVTLDNGLVLYATEQGDHFVVGISTQYVKTGSLILPRKSGSRIVWP